MPNLITVTSDSESNVLAAISAGKWGFKEIRQNGQPKEINLERIKRGDYIAIYCTEINSLMVLGLITGSPKPGKINRNIWLDDNYYNETDFKVLFTKTIHKEKLLEIFGSNWYTKKLNAWCSSKGAYGNLTEDEFYTLFDEFKS